MSNPAGSAAHQDAEGNGHARRCPQRTIDERNALVSANYRLALWAVNRYCPRARWDGVLFDELLSEAHLALLRAARYWDPERGTFANYASLLLRQKVAMYLASRKRPPAQLPEHLA